jgi:hypothetical protein
MDDEKEITVESEVKKMMGRLSDEYEIYLSFTDEDPPKTFDEWLEA